MVSIENKFLTAQTNLINVMNRELGQGIFSNFIPNYKDIGFNWLIFSKSKVGSEKNELC